MSVDQDKINAAIAYAQAKRKRAAIAAMARVAAASKQA